MVGTTQDFLHDPRLVSTTQALSNAVVTGAFAGLESPEVENLLRVRVQQFVSSLAPVLADAIRTDLSPALQAALTENIEGAMEALASDKSRVSVTAFSHDLTASIMDTLTDHLGAGVREDLGPALESMLAQNVGRGIRQALENEVGPGLEKTMGDNLGQGIEDLMRKHVVPVLDDERGKWSRDMKEVLDQGEDTARQVATASGALAILFLCGMGVLWSRGHRLGQESDRRERAVRLMASTLSEMHAEGDEAALKVVQRIKTNSRHTDGGDYLSEYLRKNKDFKVKVDPAAPQEIPE